MNLNELTRQTFMQPMLLYSGHRLKPSQMNIIYKLLDHVWPKMDTPGMMTSLPNVKIVESIIRASTHTINRGPVTVQRTGNVLVMNLWVRIIGSGERWIDGIMTTVRNLFGWQSTGAIHGIQQEMVVMVQNTQLSWNSRQLFLRKMIEFFVTVGLPCMLLTKEASRMGLLMSRTGRNKVLE